LIALREVLRRTHLNASHFSYENKLRPAWLDGMNVKPQIQGMGLTIIF
jgi:hypothetical protein